MDCAAVDRCQAIKGVGYKKVDEDTELLAAVSLEYLSALGSNDMEAAATCMLKPNPTLP